MKGKNDGLEKMSFLTKPNSNRKIKLNRNHLQLIAYLTMLIDHVAVFLLQPENLYYLPFRMLGRLSFPLFAFLLVYGYFLSENPKKQLRRLLLFAFISELPFNLANGSLFYPKQSVMWTLFLGYLLLYVIEQKRKNTLLSFLIIGTINHLIQADYGFLGISIIFMSYLYLRYYMSVIPLLITLLISSVIAPLSLLLIYFYDEHKPSKKIPYKIHYYIYPVHLLFLGVIRWLN